MKNKQGVLGLDTAKAFILVILVCAVLGFAAIITLSTLNDTTDDVLPSLTISFTNITTVGDVSDVGTGGSEITGYTEASYRDCVLTVTEAHNTTGTVLISSANYTVTDCSIYYSPVLDDEGFNNSGWTVSGSVAYKSSEATNVLQNVSGGTSGFFGNASTWFTLLSVVVIILIIGVVIFAVSRFGGGAIGGGISRGGGASDML